MTSLRTSNIMTRSCCSVKKASCPRDVTVTNLMSKLLFYLQLVMLLELYLEGGGGGGGEGGMGRKTAGASALICEEIRIPACRAMPYNVTMMPNLLHHSTQTNAALVFDQYQLLLATNCSEVLLFFLCSLFTPLCPHSFKQDSIPPCRGVCEAARLGCEPVLLRYNYTWPPQMDCAELPVYERAVCISPDAIQALPAPSPPGRTMRRKAVNPTLEQQRQPSGYRCKCRNVSRRSIRDEYTEGGYHYVIRATFGKFITDLFGHPVSMKLFVRHVYRNTSVTITPGRSIKVTFVTSSNGCFCLTHLRHGHDYLVMGRENAEARQLLFNAGSGVGGRGKTSEGGGGVVEPWKKNWPTHMQRWDERVQKRHRKKDEVSLNTN